jgi:hypothetical protein
VTPFAAILRRAVEATNALGGAFADADGEMVDSFGRVEPQRWAVLTAHYGVVLRHLVHAFGTWHYGGPEYFIVEHEGIEVVVHAVDAGYYALLAFERFAPLARALDCLRAAATELREEMVA